MAVCVYLSRYMDDIEDEVPPLRTFDLSLEVLFEWSLADVTAAAVSAGLAFEYGPAASGAGGAEGLSIALLAGSASLEPVVVLDGTTIFSQGSDLLAPVGDPFGIWLGFGLTVYSRLDGAVAGNYPTYLNITLAGELILAALPLPNWSPRRGWVPRLRAIGGGAIGTAVYRLTLVSAALGRFTSVNATVAIGFILPSPPIP